MRFCTRCVYPETVDSLSFNKEGICSVCSQIEYKRTKIDWKKRRKEFIELLKQYRDKGQYDCIVPYSGGKDSTFQAYTLIKDFKLKPLIVCFDHGFFRSKHLSVVEKTLNKLGADFLKFKPDWNVTKEVMMVGLVRKGDFCWHCHAGIFAYPMQIAIKFNIPLIIWGESLAEYQSFYSYEEKEEVDEVRFNKCVNLGITAEDMVGILNNPKITMRDLEPFRFPSYKELKAINCRSVCLGSYIPWDIKKNYSIIKKELGWEGNIVDGVPPGYEYEKVECILQGVRDYIKFIKRGYGRTSHLVSVDIRNDRLTRKEGLKLFKKYDGKRPQALDIFLKIFDMTEQEFNEIAAKHMISPYKHDFNKTKETSVKLPDYKEWMDKVDGW